MKQVFETTTLQIPKGHRHEQNFPFRRRLHRDHALQHPLSARETERGRRNRERGIPRCDVTGARRLMRFRADPLRLSASGLGDLFRTIFAFFLQNR